LNRGRSWRQENKNASQKRRQPSLTSSISLIRRRTSQPARRALGADPERRRSSIRVRRNDVATHGFGPVLQLNVRNRTMVALDPAFLAAF
jgi:hypothetical protein